MSRPKAWNGAQWVDPAFWTGSEWKSYIPPVYDVPVGQWTFDSSDEGWAYADGVSGGAIYRTTPGGWYGNVANMVSPDTKDDARPFKPGITIRCRFLWSTAPVVEGYADNRELRLLFQYGEQAIPLPSPTNGPTWTTHTHTVSSDAVNASPSSDLHAQIQLWGTNDDQVTVYLHECRMEDASTGQPLTKLGDPGWEPYVFNGQSWI